MPTQAVNDGWARLQHHVQRLLDPVLRRLATISGRRWQLLLIGLFAAVMLADVARLVWLLLPLHTTASAAALPVNVASAPADKNAGAVDIEKMAGWHLFGEAGAQPQAATAVEEQAQDTTLNLQLLGVISASEPSQARAFILADGRQQQFAVGEQLPGPGKVVLSKVLVDRAIIDNNGRYETLWLYDPNATSQPDESTAGEPPSTSTVDMRDDPSVTQLAQGARNRLYQNPGSLADIIQVAPASEGGKLIGYRVNPGRDREQFKKFGLRPGDIVTMVNDVRLDDPQRALELYSMLRSERQASITVRRGNEDVVLMVSLENSGNAD